MLTFDQFKKEVFRLAKQIRMSYLIPNSNVLFDLWEKGTEPEEVVKNHLLSVCPMPREGKK